MAIIKNYKQLARTPLRRALLDMAEAGYRAVDTEAAIKRNIKLKEGILIIKNEVFELNLYKNIYLIGVGKAARRSIKALYGLLGEHVKHCIALDVEEEEEEFEYYAGSHPLPSEKNMKATQRIIELAKKAKKDDLVIVSISGGGSALLCFSQVLSCQEEALFTKSLMEKGADIQELNTVRKHISEVKGGGLAKAIYPAHSITLLFSDVPGDNPSLIASGPTVFDSTTIQDAKDVLEKYQIPAIRLNETPKDKKYFNKARYFLVVSNSDALRAIQKKARALGFEVYCWPEPAEGEARLLGRKLLEKLTSGGKKVTVAGGETTVVVEGGGRGGRNQEVVLGALPFLGQDQALGSFASDGIDNTDAAGAIADFNTKMRSQELKLDSQAYLDRNDSYHYFEKLNDLVFTGKTGTNVADFMIAVQEEENKSILL